MIVKTLSNASYIHPDNAVEVCLWNPNPTSLIAEARGCPGREISLDIGGRATARLHFAAGRPEEPGFVFSVSASADGYLLPSFIRRTLLRLMAAEEAGAEFPVLLNGERMAAIDALALLRHMQD